MKKRLKTRFFYCFIFNFSPVVFIYKCKIQNDKTHEKYNRVYTRCKKAEKTM